MIATLYTCSLQGTWPTIGCEVLASMGTPLLQQISLMNNGLLDEIEETAGFNPLPKEFLFDTMEGMIRMFMEIENAQPLQLNA